MKWFKRAPQPEMEPIRKPANEEKDRKTTLRIEELEERLTPNAIWGD